MRRIPREKTATVPHRLETGVLQGAGVDPAQARKGGGDSD